MTDPDPHNVWCEQCEAGAGKPCRYVDNQDNRRLHRVGRLTRRPHFRRKRAAVNRNREARLAEWFRDHGHIFETPETG